MQLNIPTLGDVLILAEDWTFELKRESRNEDLYEYCPGIEAHQKLLKDMHEALGPRPAVEYIPTPIPSVFDRVAGRCASYPHPHRARVINQKEIDEWRRKREQSESDIMAEALARGWFNVTLPAGTVLRVKRIYIRGARKKDRDYDSLSFYANPGNRKAEIKGRFFASLADVHKAVFK